MVVLSIAFDLNKLVWLQGGDGLLPEIGSLLWGYFFGLRVGYWVFFLASALAALIWAQVFTSRVQKKTTYWQAGLIGSAFFVLPSLMLKIALAQTNDPAPITWMIRPVGYLGLLGGIVGPMIAIGPYLSLQGEQGPQPDRVQSTSTSDFALTNRASQALAQQQAMPSPQPKRPRPRANAWLVTLDGRSFQLLKGETSIGRTMDNDIQLIGDTTLSKRHVKIIERQGNFTIVDLGSTNGTLVNFKRVGEPMLLIAGDQVQIGDSTVLKFVTPD